MQDLRILPLISSATEIVHALGLGRFQVGRSHECDNPPSVSALPICTTPTIAVSGSSAEIDALVKDRLRSAASVYSVDSNLIKTLAPTHIITQSQCKVCAVSLEDVTRAFQADLGIAASVVCLEPYGLGDVWRDIRKVAAACRYHERGESLIASLQARMSDIETFAHSGATRPTVAAIEWLEPLMVAGNWVPEMIAMAGGKDLFGVPGEHAPSLTWDELVTADPDVIIALPCGFDMKRTRDEMYWLAERPGWTDLRAVREGNVFVCDGNQFMNRPGPRLLESLHIFAEILHPELFAPTFEHVGWQHF